MNYFHSGDKDYNGIFIFTMFISLILGSVFQAIIDSDNDSERKLKYKNIKIIYFPEEWSQATSKDTLNAFILGDTLHLQFKNQTSCQK